MIDLIIIIMPEVTDELHWDAITMRSSAAYFLGTMHGSWAVLIWKVDHGSMAGQRWAHPLI